MPPETGTQAIDRAAELLVRVVEAHRPLGVGEPADTAAIRAQGYATAVDELEHGLAALAAPVFGPDGVAVAALSISGPTIRLTRERIAELAPALLEQARLVSARLGHETRGAA